MEELLTPATVAQVLGKSRLTIIRWLRAGALKGIKVGKSWRVRPADLDAFIQRLAEQEEEGGEMSEPEGQGLQVHVPQQLLNELAALAQAGNVSIEEVVRLALSCGIEELKRRVSQGEFRGEGATC
jgi:excisionase family DNA binding protein